jgi:ABC-type polar amino acid transport system ATPase subunit
MEPSSSARELVLTARGLTKIFGDKTVLRSVDLDVARCETVTRVGLGNNAARCINHLGVRCWRCRPQVNRSGARRTSDGGYRPASERELAPTPRHRIVFQRFNLFPHLSRSIT